MLSEAYITRRFYSQSPFPAGPWFLSLHISNTAFMYAISTEDYKNIAELGHIELVNAMNPAGGLTEKISFLIQNYALHQRKFERVNIALLNTEFTMLPEAYAPAAGLKSVLTFSGGHAPVKTPLTHRLKGIHFCYVPNDELLNYLEKTFTNASIRHTGAVNIALMFSQHSLTSSQVFLNINDGFIELAIKDQNSLQFYNVFNYQTSEDILYYLLFTMEQFKLDPLSARLSIAGQVEVNDELLKNVKKYIKHVSFGVSDPSVVLNDELLAVPQHYYFTLLNQHLCEL